MRKSLPAINIQFPISQLILSGEKTIETRSYPIPTQWIKKPMWLVETPGKTGVFKARAIGIVTFGDSFRYENKKTFYADAHRHRVTSDSPWAWSQKGKWGWLVVSVQKLKVPQTIQKRRGIVFTRRLTINC